MKKLSALLVLLLLSSAVYADSSGYVEKPFSIGIGTYSSSIVYDNIFVGDDDFSGLAFSFGYAVSNQLAFRASLFSLEHDVFSSIDSSGYDLLAHFGTGLAKKGFKAYIGGGLFNDKWKNGAVSRTFSGLQLSGGIGYNWEMVSLEFILGIRDASDYEDFVNETLFNDVSAAAVSGSLLLSYRF